MILLKAVLTIYLIATVVGIVFYILRDEQDKNEDISNNTKEK